MTAPVVVISQRRLVAYRAGLFEALRAACEQRGIELRLVYGASSASDRKRGDDAHLTWADEVDARWFTVAGADLLWQPLPKALRNADLVILTQENKILSNYPLLARRLARRPDSGTRIGFWGHGRNLQSTNPDGWSERFKKLLSTRVDWWFAYNQGTVDILTANGFPADHITRLDNAIDDVAFTKDLDSVTESDLDELRAAIDLRPGAPVGLYCGALYAEKRVDRLVEVGDQIHDRLPDFRLVVVGDGPARAELDALLTDRPWARTVGTASGVTKAAWFRLATVQLSPGAVGLHVLDSFVSGVPLITTADALHGPEIDYLVDGVNGLLVEDDPERFALAAVDLLGDPARLTAMVEAGREAAGRYTMANMVDNFVTGIEAALGR